MQAQTKLILPELCISNIHYCNMNTHGVGTVTSTLAIVNEYNSLSVAIIINIRRPRGVIQSSGQCN